MDLNCHGEHIYLCSQFLNTLMLVSRLYILGYWSSSNTEMLVTHSFLVHFSISDEVSLYGPQFSAPHSSLPCPVILSPCTVDLSLWLSAGTPETKHSMRRDGECSSEAVGYSQRTTFVLCHVWELGRKAVNLPGYWFLPTISSMAHSGSVAARLWKTQE